MKSNGSTIIEDKLRGTNQYKNFKARNIEDFLTTIENHELSWDREIIIIEFEDQLKLKKRNQEQYGLFLNDKYNKKTANQLPEIMLHNGAFIAEISDTSLNQPIPVYGHKDLLQYSDLKNQNQSEIILLKPEMTVLSIHGIGILQMYDLTLR